MITEDELRNYILKGIAVIKYILFKILYIKLALVLVVLWAVIYGIIYAATGFDGDNGAIASIILMFYLPYVIVKNAVKFYKWLYQK